MQLQQRAARCAHAVTASRSLSRVGGFARLPAGRPVPRKQLPARCAAAVDTGKKTLPPPPPPITLSEGALGHLKKLRAESGGDDLLLRMGVKSGGCSGMSYVMDFEKPENINKSDDMVMEYDGFRLVCDSKSLLYLFGMELDWSSALVGGGFQFHNPQANSSCGCGKSFGV